MMQHESLYLENFLKNYLTFPHEIILFAKRQSLLTLIPPLAGIVVVGLIFLGAMYPAFYLFLSIPYLFFLGAAVILMTAIFLVMKQIIEWYYHIYIITDRKLLEIKYVPLAFYTVNDVLLDQVQCTEIDVRMHGFLFMLLDIGNIAITFDRPTHQDEFVLSHIGSAREIGSYLTNQLIQSSNNRLNNTLWYRNKNGSRGYTMIDLTKTRGAL